MPGKSPHISDEKRHEIVLTALETDERRVHIAARNGIHRNRLYQLIEDAIEDPDEAVQQAERELEYRRRVAELAESYRQRRKRSGGKEK